MAARPVTIAALRQSALDAEKRGDAAEGMRQFDRALALAPGDAALANSAAGSALRTGMIERALDLYSRAVRLDPGNPEFAINLAIAMGQAGQPTEAVSALRAREHIGGNLARYWSVRAAREREAGDLDAAATSFDRCLALEPGHALALHGRARVALERGEPDAAARYDRALASKAGDPELWLGRAMALEAQGDVAGARDIAWQLSESLPAWTVAHRYLADMDFGAEPEGDAFAAPFARALERAPQAAPDLVWGWCEALLGADRFAAAARVSAEALERFPADDRIRLAAATAASANGELERASGLFAGFRQDDARVWLEHARHRLKNGEPDAAERLLATLVDRDSSNVEGWALRSLAWRLLGDPREEWLHGQPGLVQCLALNMPPGDLDRIVAALDRVHDGSVQPVGQSVRGGSQTRGALFARMEPELRELRDAVRAVVERYRQGLPAYDARHPLLCHREDSLAITGSWSVRLQSHGRHTVHVHPRGILSSALYLRLPPPDDREPRAGWLELGLAPPEMNLPIAPRTAVEPEVGVLALFPSTLYHGTRPFPRGQRLTVAFDVTANAR